MAHLDHVFYLSPSVLWCFHRANMGNTLWTYDSPLCNSDPIASTKYCIYMHNAYCNNISSLSVADCVGLKPEPLPLLLVFHKLAVYDVLDNITASLNPQKFEPTSFHIWPPYQTLIKNNFPCSFNRLMGERSRNWRWKCEEKGEIYFSVCHFER